MRRLVPLAAIACVSLLAGCTSARPGAPKRAAPGNSTGATTAPAASTTAPRATPTGWLTYDHDPQRSGNDPSSPPAGAVEPSWTSPLLDGAVYAQPLVTSSAVIVASEDDSVYSLNPATGAVQWRRHLGDPVAGSNLPCGNIDPSGITGTPVIDATDDVVWVVTFSARPLRHTLWALRLADGTVVNSRSADPPGSDPRTDQQRGALTLDSGRVYIPYGGLYGDCGDYHGRLFGIPALGSRGPSVSYVTPAARAGIWAPAGPAVGGDGHLLIATGNGLPVNPPGDANSVISLTPVLAVSSRFVDPDSVSLSETDRDLGSTSPTLVGGEVVQVGKQGVAYVLSADLRATLSSTRVCAGGFGATAIAGNTVYLPCFDGLYALQVGSGSVRVKWKVTSIRPGPPIVAGGTVWTIDRNGQVVGYDTSTGSPVYRHAIAVAGSFPALASYKGTLYAAAGDHVEAFKGA